MAHRAPEYGGTGREDVRLPRIYFDISLDGRALGRIYITLWPDAFPDGVENLIGLVLGQTYYRRQTGDGRRPEYQSQPRTLAGSRFHGAVWNEYLLGGDIYQGRGTMAATIWDDRPYPPPVVDYTYAHDVPYILSLVPRRDPETDDLSYDSTLMITLAPAADDNLLGSLIAGQIAIGRVTGGTVYLEQINTRLRPVAGRRPPEIRIVSCGTV